jgi:hypothetical protein
MNQLKTALIDDKMIELQALETAETVYCNKKI